MKAAFVLALPALALAAATPKIEERQIPGLPGLPDTTLLFNILNAECLKKLTGLTKCLGNPVDGSTSIRDIAGCPVVVLISVGTCVKLPEVPVPVPEIPGTQ